MTARSVGRYVAIAVLAAAVIGVLSAQALVALENIAPHAPPLTAPLVVATITLVIGRGTVSAAREGDD